MAVDKKVKVADKSAKNKLVKFFNEIKAEVRRITWPTKKEVKKASIAVAVVCIVYMIYIGVLDSAYQYLYNLVFNIK